MQAVVDGSRWIARCPYCNGAEMVNYTTLRFFCCECRNRDNGHDYLTVTAPLADREAIERELLLRDDWRYRAWTPGETIDDLRRQRLENQWR